jgi:photosystem II stability/assembly factor-like uncharacterized protein
MKLLIIFTVLITTLQLNSQDINWHEQNSGVTTSLNCASSSRIEYKNIWACGNNKVVLWTNNLGDNWINIGAGLPDGIDLNSIAAIDTNTAVTSGNIGVNTFVYKTTNKGGSWFLVFSQTGGHINALSSDAGFMSGNPVEGRWSLWKSPDKGTTWDSTGLYLPQSGAEMGFSNSMYINGIGIWIGTSNSRIYYSSNSGINWQVQTITGEQNIYTINFSFSDGFAGGNQLYKTTNKGETWLTVPTIGTGEIKSIVMPIYIIPIGGDNSLPDIFYIRNNNSLYRVNDFNQSIPYSAQTGIYRYLTTTPNNIFAVRDNGGITAGFQSITGWSDPPGNYPYSFELKQNYPNPFNPKTTIPILLYRSTHISLKIYNSTGELVSTLLDGQKNLLYYDYIPYGYYYALEWDASAYPSGVYYYKVVSDDYTETKKMMLIK